jgi:hypothetical protein
MHLAPMGCAVQIHKSSERRGTWAANAADGWYLQTSPKHYCYQCHNVYVNSIRIKSEILPDKVHFKHKYITQPTLMPEDTIMKALKDLTQALIERRNMKGNEQIKVLQKIDKLLNKVPTTANMVQPKTTTDSRQVTFEETSKPPQETQQTPRVANKRQSPSMVMPSPSITKATIDNPMPNETPPLNAPPLNAKDHSTANIKLCHLIRAATNSRARIPQPKKPTSKAPN